ncbi:E3 ubiquitin-protein ligase TRIM56-like [Anneissia japonica]|uniref:E3 ubiquitin-protein ligase TRIM56-like n=1 Tax=Anneissia japonica TaxID=1529436 RepID=UPI00142574BE|nr:E3 ubiquitin-protein ligase TRIM56-like [Anneissia japonica]
MASEITLFEDANKEFLTCSICKDIFKHPKQITCMHNFCQDCLQPLIKEGTPHKLKCPLCREEVELTVDTIDELEDNLFLSNLCELFLVANLNTVDVLCSFCSEALNEGNASRCIDCSDNLCDKCAKTHTLTRLTRNHQVILMSELKTETLVRKSREGNVKIPCQKHSNNHLEYFCQTCQVPVCLGCTVVDHVRQNGHSLINLQDGPTKEKFKEQITEQLNKLEEIIPSFEKHIDIANETEKCLIKSLEKTKNDIRDTAKSLIDEIEAHSKSLIEKVDKKAEAIQKSVEHHRESAEIRVKSSTKINQFARNLCKHGLNAEIMSSAKDLLRRMKELQEDMKDLEGTGELRFVRQDEFKFGVVKECKIIERDEYSLLEYYTEKEMAVTNSVKRGPHWPTGFDGYDNNGRYNQNRIQSIRRNGPNDIGVTVCFQSGSNMECKMNPGDYWLQPTNVSSNYQSRLECYTKNFMKVGDEVKRGLHWPPGSYDSYDERGQKSGKITQINQTQSGTIVTVDFGPPGNQTCQFPMNTGNYHLLPLHSYPFIHWVEF